MATTVSTLLPLDCLPGVEPVQDNTAFATNHYSFSENIRFQDGKPQKIGGWNEQTFDGEMTIEGKIRSIYSTVFSNRVQTIIGTHQKLYNVSGSTLTNITPATTSSVAVANSLATHYATLANNPISTVNGSNTVTVADTEAAKFVPGDIVNLSGATAVGGVGALALNTIHMIRSIGVNSYTFRVSAAATSTATGGGAAVIRSSGLITVTKNSHGQDNGDRASISGAANTGGILAADINKIFEIRNVATNTFDIMTAGVATSSVSSAGGGSTIYYPEIPEGNENEVFGQGYGMGMYGAGLYGTALLSNSGRSYPRIWFTDRYGDYIITTPGQQTPVYRWDGSIATTPTPVTNAPTAVNYAFISDNTLVTFGAGGVPNKIFSSNQGDITNWTASSLNTVFEDNVEGAGRLTSHANVDGINIIFTEQRSYTMRFVGKDSGVWQIKPLEPIGIIAPMARVVVNGIVVWMGVDNFYMYRGGSVEIVPSNSLNESTILDYVYEDLNFSQKSKIFAWYNKQFNEIWFHYPSISSMEPDRVACVNVKDFTWWPLSMGRTAAEYPETNLTVPRLATIDSKIYRHESGVDDVLEPLPWSLTFNKRAQPKIGKNNIQQMTLIPDSYQVGSINVHINSWQFPQSTVKTYSNDYTVTATTEQMPVNTTGKIYQYIFSGEELGQDWRMGQWAEEVQTAGIN